MFARVATFDGIDPSRIDEAIEQTRSEIESGADSPPEGLEGVKEAWMLVDRESGRGLAITLFDDEEELRRGDEALNRMSPPAGGGRRSSVDHYEVAIRQSRS